MKKMIEDKEEIQEIQLSGEKLSIETKDLHTISEFGYRLYKDNEKFIKEKIPENWFGLIEPLSGIFIASIDQDKLNEYAMKKFKGRLLYSVGLLKDAK